MGEVRTSGARRLTLTACAAVFLSVSTASAAGAPARRVARKLAGIEIDLKTVDGWTLGATYQAPKDSHTVFVLLHETGGRKENWYLLTKAMAKNGFGYLALDLRGHGTSQKPPPGQDGRWPKFRIDKEYNEWNNMGHDIEAAVAYLKVAGVMDTSIALGGADVGSSIALRYAAVHKEVPMMFMLSPGFKYREVLTVNPIRLYGKRPILLVVGADDARQTIETSILFQFVGKVAGPENAVMWTAEKDHGTKMLAADKTLVSKLIDWMEHPELAALPPPSISSAPAEGTPPSDLPSDQQLENPTEQPTSRDPDPR